MLTRHLPAIGPTRHREGAPPPVHVIIIAATATAEPQQRLHQCEAAPDAHSASRWYWYGAIGPPAGIGYGAHRPAEAGPTPGRGPPVACAAGVTGVPQAG